MELCRVVVSEVGEKDKRDNIVKEVKRLGGELLVFEGLN